MTDISVIQLRRATATYWWDTNPVLRRGEPGFEIDTLKLKIGNGSTPWRTLAYLTPDDLITETELNEALAGFTTVPSGVISQYVGATAPTGYLFCRGQQLNRADYPTLFNALGGTSSPYGLPNSTTFNVPDLQTKVAVGKSTSGRFAALGNSGGADAVQLNETQMPVHSHNATSTQGTHSHTAGDYGHAHNTWNNYQVAAGSGAIMTGSDGDGRGNATQTGYASVYVNPSSAGAITTTIANAGGSGGITQTHENMPPFIVVNYIIKT